MDSVHVPAGSIVVGVDGSSGSDAALRWGADQAALERRPLAVVHAVAPVGFPGASIYPYESLDYSQLLTDLRGAGHDLLEDAERLAHEQHPELDVRRVLSDADPRVALLELAKDAAMVVVGSRGRGPVSTFLLGSVSVTVSKHAACPVVVHRPTHHDTPRFGVLVGVDGSAHSTPAIEFAYRMASWRRLPLIVLHTFWDARGETGTPTPDQESEEALVAECLAGMAEKFPDVDVSVRLARGFADRHLVNASHNYDLIVIGHHRIALLDEVVYGSVAPTVVEHADGPVAVVPSQVSYTGDVTTSPPS